MDGFRARQGSYADRITFESFNALNPREPIHPFSGDGEDLVSNPEETPGAPNSTRRATRRATLDVEVLHELVGL